MRRARLPLVLALTALSAFGLAAPASAVVACTFLNGTVSVTLGDGDTATIVRSGDAIVVNGTPCESATVTTTDTIAITANGVPTEIAIDLSGGVFGPGATAEADGSSEIEFTVAVPSGLPVLRIVGSTLNDNVVVGDNGINLDASETADDADVTITGSPSVVLDGGDGNDTLSVAGGAGTGAPSGGATVVGGAAGDLLLGGLGGSTFDGGDGPDELDYSSAVAIEADVRTSTVQHTGGGVDTFSGVETITGSPGADELHGDAGANTLQGGAGADVLDGNEGDDTLDGGGGVDRLDFGDVGTGVTVDLADGIAVGEGTDFVSAVENVTGSSANDELVGDGSANRLDGGPGNDTIDGGRGPDTLNGGAGDDRVSYGSATRPVAVDLRDGTAEGAGSDTVEGFENVDGGPKADVIHGSDRANALDGRGGADEVFGHGGTDAVIGSDGNDVLVGQRGNDRVLGDDGKDRLDGGQGRDDDCRGGRDPDSFVNCESIR